MFSIFTILPIFAAAAASLEKASAGVSVPAAASSVTTLTFLKDFGLDETLFDAVSEAVLALLVFGSASAMLTAYRKRTKSHQPKKAKFAVQVPEKSSPTSSLNRFEQAERIRNAAGCGERSERTPTPKPTSKLTASQSRGSQTEADTLANAVRTGRASQLPALLDGALARSMNVVNRQQSPATQEEVAGALLHSALRACAANRCFNDAIAAYEHMAASIGSGNSGLWSVLLYCIVEASSFGKCKNVFENLCKLGEPSGHDFVNMVRCFTARQDADGLQEMLTRLQSSGLLIENYAWNRALAACGASESALQLAEALLQSNICAEGIDSVGYNTLMKYHARAGNFARCFELHSEMIEKGLEASEVTFGILLDACVAAREFECAKKVFDDLCSSGLKLNVVHCTTFIKSLLHANKLEEAAAVLREMSTSSGVKPDLITYSTVVKAFSDAGDVRSALKILQEMIAKSVRADEIIFNSVLTGCTVFPIKSTQVMQTFDALIKLGMKPTTTTLSILLKALAHTESWAISLQVLKDAPRTLKLQPETRLYVQLCQACVKARASKEVLEVFDVMLVALNARKERVDPAFVSRLLRSCVLSGDQQVATDLREAAVRAGITVEPQMERMMSTALTKKTARQSFAQEVEASPAGSLTGSLSGKAAMRPAWMKSSRPNLQSPVSA